MGNLWVRFSCSTQLLLIIHQNCITNIFLSIFYAIDVLAYSLGGAREFLQRRSDLYGPNYASLGKIICGEYNKCAKIINSPQQRGAFLGRARLMPSRVSSNFPLFLSDSDAGGSDMHEILHQHFWEEFSTSAFGRLSDSAFQDYLREGVEKINANGKARNVKKVVQEMTAKYIFHAIFGLVLTEEQVKAVTDLFFSNGPTSSYVTGALRPYAVPFGCLQCKRRRLISSLTELVMSSPALENYFPNDSTVFMSKSRYAEILLEVTGIAGCLGSFNLCIQVLNDIPQEYPINLEDKMEMTLAVLEAARLRAPVNNVNVILHKEMTLSVNYTPYVFPRGTVVAASIGLASLDPNEFDQPMEFNPKRSNLIKSSITFNHVGFSPVGSGKRQCPGRNIAMKMACDLLVENRKSYAPP